MAVLRQQNTARREEGQTLVKLIESAMPVGGGRAPATSEGAVGTLLDLIA